MDLLVKSDVKMADSARFGYESQIDLVKLINMIDPSDLELNLSLTAATSPRFQELNSKITDYSQTREQVHPDYSDRVIQLGDNKISSPSFNPQDILPLGIRRFISDLDELVELSEREKIIPLLEVTRKENYEPKIRVLKVSNPKIDNSSEKLKWDFVSNLDRFIERKLYAPRIEKLRSMGGLARGLRPSYIFYENIRENPEVVKDCFKTLETVPKENNISYFRIGSQPRDQGGREYYEWKCKSSISMCSRENKLLMEFEQMTDVKKIENDLKQAGINLHLIE